VGRVGNRYVAAWQGGQTENQGGQTKIFFGALRRILPTWPETLPAPLVFSISNIMTILRRGPPNVRIECRDYEKIAIALGGRRRNRPIAIRFGTEKLE